MIYLIALALMGGACLLMYMLREAFADRVVYKELSFPEFPESFGEIKLFFISDIHKRTVSETVIGEIKEKKPDLVIIGGDLLEKGVPFERVKKNLMGLKTCGPVYFVWGNNDYEADYHQLDALLLECGVKILDNTALSFESIEGERFILMGTDDLSKDRDRLDLALKDAGSGGFRVLVSHDPRIINSITKEQNIHLVLSGHTHGGQIRIFGFGPYEKGRIKALPQTTILISNGYGTTGVPLRLGAKPETHFITLNKS
ncbi:putative MPP superfamily phosphohydrolase [Cytobacillus firmus]|uniref:Putative MPP superfamily phosphohydrolase n=2 Tax=Cytobacillus TaxID=2675230 RepID=A0A366JNT9_CYTFI|nr:MULTISPECIES: metallophosphoesterase [Cytobacillus]RBP89564.1 putative MPP superfamily phosphohydrolase [Cytobacillus firmus]TDX47209.1 putative MPP superfamily phosphohydrolase [Cytobacillus oceanisediminis]